MKSVAHLSVVHHVYDIRIYHKECKSLSKTGYDVHLIIPHERDEVSENIHIISLPIKFFNKSIFKTYIILPFISLLKSLKINAHVYHLHDPQLIPIGIMLKLFQKKVVYDVHEDHKEMPKRKFFRILFGIYEMFAVRIFDKFIAATPKIGRKFPKDKTIILCNYPILSFIDKNIKNINKINISNKPVLIYQGGLTRTRGIKQLIEAIGILNNNAHLVLLGNWEKGLKEECEKLKGWNNTIYLGFKPLSEVYSYTSSSDIGVVIFLPHPNHNEALPNKPFEYMASSIPFIFSNFKYWEGIFSECGLSVNPEDPKDIAGKIQELINNKKLRIRLGKRGRELVEIQYSWERESEKLIDLYKELCSN